MPLKFKPFTTGPHPGVKITEPDQVVPDQSLSLKEILTRFVRHEALPVGQKGVYGSEGSIDPEAEHDLNIDLEKARYMDLTEKAEFGERVKEYMEQHDSQEKERAEARAKSDREKAEAVYQKRVRIEARKLAKKSGGKPDSI